MTPAAEFNIWADPEAAQRVFHSGLDVTMIGLDVTHARAPHARLGRALPRRRPRRHLRRRAGRVLQALPRAHVRLGRRADPRRRRARARVPARARPTEHLNVEVETSPELCRGRTVVDRWHRTDRAPNAHVGVVGRRRRLLRAPARADRHPRVSATADAARARATGRRRARRARARARPRRAPERPLGRARRSPPAAQRSCSGAVECTR